MTLTLHRDQPNNEYRDTDLPERQHENRKDQLQARVPADRVNNSHYMAQILLQPDLMVVKVCGHMEEPQQIHV